MKILVISLIFFALVTFHRFIIYIFRESMYANKFTKLIVDFCDWIFSSERLNLTAAVLEVIIFSALFLYQKQEKIRLINLSSGKTDLLSIYGLIIAVISMYGVYLGFLQFIISDLEKAKYLGRNKVMILTNESLWYQMTQSRVFFCILFILLISPIVFVNSNGNIQSGSLYAGQTSIFMLLIVYLFLIKMSLRIILILFLVKSKRDTGMKNKVEFTISNDYFNLFQKIYKNKFKKKDIDYFFETLELELNEVEEKEIDKFLSCVFLDDYQLLAWKFSTNRKISRHEYNEYKVVIEKKYKLIDEFNSKIAFDTYQQLIERDMSFIYSLIKQNPLLIDSSEDIERTLSTNSKLDNINEYLFERLLEKYLSEHTDLSPIAEFIISTARVNKENFRINEDKNEKLLNYFDNIEKYEWTQIFSNYFENNYGLKDLKDFGLKNDENYFKAFLNYSANSNPLITIRIGNVINLLSEVNIITYSFLLLFSDDQCWINNALELKKLIEKKIKYKTIKDVQLLIKGAISQFDEFNLSYINTNKLLFFLERSSDSINDMNFFKQYHELIDSDFKILFVKEIFDINGIFSLGINLPDGEIYKTKELCFEYLHQLEETPSIVEFKELEYTMENLLNKFMIDSKDFPQDIGIFGLLYLEYLKKDQNLFVDLVFSYKYKHRKYYSFGKDIFDFFLLKLLETSYKQYFKNDNFLIGFLESGIRILDGEDLSIDEHINLLYSKIKGFPYNDVGKESLLIISKRIKHLYHNYIVKI